MHEKRQKAQNCNLSGKEYYSNHANILENGLPNQEVAPHENTENNVAYGINLYNTQGTDIKIRPTFHFKCR